jgi:hypothetical protein
VSARSALRVARAAMVGTLVVGCGADAPTIDPSAIGPDVTPPGKLAQLAPYASGADIKRVLGVSPDVRGGLVPMVVGRDAVRRATGVNGAVLSGIYDDFGRLTVIAIADVSCAALGNGLTERWGPPLRPFSHNLVAQVEEPPNWAGTAGWAAWLVSPSGSPRCSLQVAPWRSFGTWLPIDGRPPDVPAWVTPTLSVGTVERRVPKPEFAKVVSTAAGTRLAAGDAGHTHLDFDLSGHLRKVWTAPFEENEVRTEVLETLRSVYGPPGVVRHDPSGWLETSRFLPGSGDWFVEFDGFSISFVPRIRVADLVAGGAYAPLARDGVAWGLLGATADQVRAVYPTVTAHRDELDVDVALWDWSSGGSLLRFEFQEGVVARAKLATAVLTLAWRDELITTLREAWGPAVETGSADEVTLEFPRTAIAPRRLLRLEPEAHDRWDVTLEFER